MAISDKHSKILWANAAGRCAFTECRIRLTADASRVGSEFTLGEMAHIEGERPGANRHNPGQNPGDRNAYGNLILLCPNHHTLIDKPENEAAFSVEMLQGLKAAHEQYVNARLDGVHYETKAAVAAAIVPLLDENYAAFNAYGPHSDIARRNPLSDAHAVWLEERLSTIVPNNRAVAGLLEKHRNLFEASESGIIARFLQHVRSYERWVREESTYEGVPRFPVEFEQLMKEAGSVSA